MPPTGVQQTVTKSDLGVIETTTSLPKRGWAQLRTARGMLGDTRITPQRTLAAASRCRGIGLHSGKRVTMTLLPAAPGTGIVFRRIDAGAEIRAVWSNTIEAALCTL